MKRFYKHHPVASQSIGALAHVISAFCAVMTVLATFSPEFQLRTSGILVGITGFFALIYHVFPHSDEQQRS